MGKDGITEKEWEDWLEALFKNSEQPKYVMIPMTYRIGRRIYKTKDLLKMLKDDREEDV